MNVSIILPIVTGLFLLSFFSYTFAADSQKEQCKILSTEMDKQIIFRQDPGFSQKAIAKVRLNDIKTITKNRISNDEQWIHVNFDTRSGWINTLYIKCKYSPQTAQQIISDIAKKTIDSIKNKNWKNLAALVHPDKGIRFSPSLKIDLKKHQVIKANKLHNEYYSPFKKTWGTNTKKGTQIKMTFADYAEQYIHRDNYWDTTSVKFNQFSHAAKNPTNLESTYPHSIIVEYRGKTSASNLYLIFEESEFEWRIVAIAGTQK
ncbi:hypothetical protein MNBD_GAMMA12-1312 [hydrothermal vent metagenome]|uniref:SH3b domain-containing protein n=1 Tax=hydrothermal vent metagenome TaxID=652676 RepID=A0A3B0XV19_9ZZZZ